MDYTKIAHLVIGASGFQRSINDLKGKHVIGERLILACKDDIGFMGEVDLKIIDISSYEIAKKTIYILEPSNEEERETIKTACFKSKNWRTISYLPPKDS